MPKHKSKVKSRKTSTRKITKRKSSVRTRTRITSTDSRIFASLHRAKRPLPIQRLAKRTDLSWKTTNDHVKKLERMRILKTRKTIRKTNVFIDPRFRSILNKRK